jgi:hypothetical protein
MQFLRFLECFFVMQFTDKHHFTLNLNDIYIAYYTSQYTKYKGIMCHVSEKKG